MTAERQVRMLKDYEGGTLKAGDVVWLTEKGAAHYVEIGAAEYTNTSMNDNNLAVGAKKFFLDGFNVVPCVINGSDKQPLVEWKKWGIERQTEQEFNALDWTKANAVAVVCGTKLKNGFYLAVVDSDVKKLPQEVIDNGKEALKKMPITRMEKTPSGGIHYPYYSKIKPKTISVFHDTHGLELLGEKKLCLVYPSEGYQQLNDNAPTEVENIEALFNIAVGAEAKEPTVWFDRKEIVAPYAGKEPNCVKILTRGTTEGKRNAYGIRIASYYANFKGLKTDTCLKILKDWNKLNTPKLETEAIEEILKYALQNEYMYGCSDDILKSVCKKEGCPLTRKERKATTEQEKTNALNLLLDPKILDYVVIHGRKHLIGEDGVLVQNFIILLSGQTHYPISEVLTGYSGSGKNESLRAVKPLIPEIWIYEFTTSTPEAIKYIPEDFAGTLVIYELAGIRSETGSLSLRSIGEGEGIKTIFAFQNKQTGKPDLGEHETKAKNFISTDSGLDIQADLYRRVLKTSMNGSLALTKRVIAKKLRDGGIPESLRKILYPEINKIVYSEVDFQNALSTLDLNLEVVTFQPTTLLKLASLPIKQEQQVALRTQIERIMYFIKNITLLYQKQRIRFRDNIRKIGYVIADVADVEKALLCLEDSLTETVLRIEKRQKEALGIIENYPDGIDKNMLSKEMNCSSVTAAAALKSLFRNGYLKEIQDKKPFKYKLQREKNEKETPKSLLLSENISEYRTNYRKELRNFLNTLLLTFTSDTGNIFSFEIPEQLEKKYGLAEIKVKKVLSVEKEEFIPEKKPESLISAESKSENESIEQEQKKENKPETNTKAEIKPVSLNNEEPKLCSSYCAVFGSAKCSAKNPEERSEKALMPLKCPSFRPYEEEP